jgi:hypothetical protein
MGGGRMTAASATNSLLTIDVKHWMGTDLLGSREQGRKMREFLMDHIQHQESIRLDFRHVDVMTSAFADECFGKLWDSTSHSVIKQTIHITGLTGNNKAVFRFVLVHRS